MKESGQSFFTQHLKEAVKVQSSCSKRSCQSSKFKFKVQVQSSTSYFKLQPIFKSHIQALALALAQLSPIIYISLLTASCCWARPTLVLSWIKRHLPTQLLGCISLRYLRQIQVHLGSINYSSGQLAGVSVGQPTSFHMNIMQLVAQPDRSSDMGIK